MLPFYQSLWVHRQELDDPETIIFSTFRNEIKEKLGTSSKSGIACIWIGVGASYPEASKFFVTVGERFKCSLKSSKLSKGEEIFFPITAI